MSCKTPFRAGPLSGAFLCTALLLCASCASSPDGNRSSAGRKRHSRQDRTAASPAVYITDSKTVSLLPPECMEGSLNTLQLFTGSYGTQRFSFQAYTRADAEGLSMTLLNEMGITVATLSYTKDGTNFQSAYMPSSIRAEYMLLDFQNCYYDADALRDHYAANGLRFECWQEGGREYRRIYDGSDSGTRGSRQDGSAETAEVPEVPIEEIIREKPGQQGASVRVVNKLRSYRYELLELEETEGGAQ